jgi:putative PIN family toxin of toxin-antitoxin system
MPLKKERIIVDTNIFISFLINRDYSKLDKIIIENKATILLSDKLIDELITVLSRPKFKKYISKEDLNTLMLFFNEYGELVNVTSKVKLSRDANDDFLLALAKDGKATFLITGDKDLLVLKKISQTKIVSISDFLNRYSD